jgi:hypothetical protein
MTIDTEQTDLELMITPFDFPIPFWAQMIIDMGADLEIKDSKGLTALQVSLLSGGCSA